MCALTRDRYRRLIFRMSSFFRNVNGDVNAANYRLDC